jgi:acetyl esterase/lipase
VRFVARCLALVVAIVTLFLASWIVIPAPTYFLLTFGVGAPEVSEWLVLGALVAIGLGLAGTRSRVVTSITVGAAVAALVLASSIFIRVPGAISRFDRATTGLSAEPPHALRARPLILADLFKGIAARPAKATRGIPFASPDGQPLTLDVYQPVERGRYPIVVQIYGGAWQRGQPGDNSGFASLLASSGYVVIAVDYRHAPRYKWQAQMADIDTSLMWVRDHAAQYDGDTSRVVLMGRSAGAHLAMLAAYRTPAVRVRGVVSYYGPVFLADAFEHPPSPDPLHVRDTEIAFLGGTPDQVPEAYAAASPVTYANRALPPTLLVYGRRDHIVEARYGERMRTALAANGGKVAYLEIPWAEHAFDAVFFGPSSQIALYYTERFIAWAVR